MADQLLGGATTNYYNSIGMVTENSAIYICVMCLLLWKVDVRDVESHNLPDTH